MSEIRFYLDENMNPAIAEQLAKSDIDVVTVRDIEQLGDRDINHLQRATEMGRVLCTHDTDFLKLRRSIQITRGLSTSHTEHPLAQLLPDCVRYTQTQRLR